MIESYSDLTRQNLTTKRDCTALYCIRAFRMASMTAFLVFLVVITTCQASVQTIRDVTNDDDVVEFMSQDERPLLNSCELSNDLSENYQCWLTQRVEHNGVISVGQFSVCRNRDDAADWTKCVAGNWMGLEGNKRKEPTRKRRFVRIRFRFRIRFFGRRSRRSPPPPPPNRPPYFTDCAGRDKQETASANQLTAVVTWSVPSAADPDGGSPSVSQVMGPAPGSKIGEGRHGVAYKVRDSGGLSDSCHFSVSVNVVQCSRAQYVPHGTQSCTGPRHNIYGSVCGHTCNKGYQISGTAAVTCQSNGQWSSSFPTCDAVSCGPPQSVSNGQLTCPQGHTYRELCLLSCNQGYTIVGSPYVSCGETSQWSTSGQCQDTEAPKFSSGCPPNQNLFSGPLEAPVSVTWIDPVVQDNSGQSVILTSSVAKGTLHGPGIHFIKVTATDQSGNAAFCSFVVSVQVRRCLALMAPVNGRLFCTQGYIEGSACSVVCNSGYQLQGNSTQTCLSTEMWSGSTATCTAVRCPSPQATHVSFACSNGLQYLSTCFVTCASGFTLQGMSHTTCQQNGTWSDFGFCKDTEGPVFANSPCQDNIDLFANRLGQDNPVIWSDPPVTDNSGGSVTLTSDVPSGSLFPIGVTHVTYNATDQSGNSRTCSFSVTVNTLTCAVPDLEAPNRTMTLMTYTCPDGYLYGASCTINCTYGYPLIGSDSITCERTGNTQPPTMTWDWQGPSGVPPACAQNTCPTLPPPVNGALQCLLGNFGWDCLMSCHQDWDIPAATDGHYYCTNSAGTWQPRVVLDCLQRVYPFSTRVMSQLFYFAGSCNTSTASLQQNFITRLSNSKWKDACVNVPNCVASNVQVTCGPMNGRRKRSTGSALPAESHLHSVHKRSSPPTHFIMVDMEFTADYVEGTGPTAVDDAFQKYSDFADAITTQLRVAADNGEFDIGTLTTDATQVVLSSLSVDCPAGTFYNRSRSPNSLSCRSCSKGYYLKDLSTGCLPCPIGSYTELDNSTSCSLCAPGWSTLSEASHSQDLCLELCTPGFVSANGFAPCQPCAPGQYMSQVGGVTCNLCPTDTWTPVSAATNASQCIPSDVHLTNSSVVGKVEGSLNSLTLALWVNMKANNSAVLLSLTLEADPSDVTIGVIMYTDGANVSDVVVTPAATELIDIGSWRKVVLTVNSATGSIDWFFNRSAFYAHNVSMTAVRSAVLNISTEDKGVIISGLRAEDRLATLGEISQASTDCGGSYSNLMRWQKPPTGAYTPSKCDAVDECLSAPCGFHGNCLNELGRFLCVCTNGWTGATCQTAPDACYQHDCQNGATCVPGSLNYTCVCDSDYSGLRCELDKVAGGWGEWMAWTNCSAVCEGQRQRQRDCTNPAPMNGGANCSGNSTETQPCGQADCPVDGGWTTWGQYTSCSATCQGGQRTRARFCTQPAPEHGGQDCEGSDSMSEACNTNPCPVHGAWSEWSAFDNCSKPCGGGVQSRNRTCTSPSPSLGGNQCIGAANETTSCNSEDCPECARLYRSRNTYLSCQEDTNPYLKTCVLACLFGYTSPVTFPNYTCGEETGYIWSHQKDSTFLPDLPACSKPTTLSGVSLVHTVPLDTGCGSSSESSAQQQMSQRAGSWVPCGSSTGCSMAVNAGCGDGSNSSKRRRRRRSVNSLAVTVQLNYNFGSSVTLDPNDTTALANYESLLLAVDNAYTQLTNASLYTISLNGQVIVANFTSSSEPEIEVYCPAGSVLTDVFCVECPAGSKEVNGACVLCPLGHYQDEIGSVSCKTCLNGLSWDVEGATNVTQCLFEYDAQDNDDDDDDDDGDDGNVAIIVGCVCATIVVVAAIVGAVIVYKTKMSTDKRRAGSAWSMRRVSVQPYPLSASPDLFPPTVAPPSYLDAAGRCTPSALELRVSQNKYLFQDGKAADQVKECFSEKENEC